MSEIHPAVPARITQGSVEKPSAGELGLGYKMRAGDQQRRAASEHLTWAFCQGYMSEGVHDARQRQLALSFTEESIKELTRDIPEPPAPPEQPGSFFRDGPVLANWLRCLLFCGLSAFIGTIPVAIINTLDNGRLDALGAGLTVMFIILMITGTAISIITAVIRHDKIDRELRQLRRSRS